MTKENTIATIMLIALIGMVLVGAQLAHATNESSYTPGIGSQACDDPIDPYCIGYFIPHNAHATNEHDYKLGYWFGFNNYNCINEFEPYDPGPYPSQMSGECDLGKHGTIGWVIANSTACVDGYINGFVHWCGIEQPWSHHKH